MGRGTYPPERADHHALSIQPTHPHPPSHPTPLPPTNRSHQQKHPNTRPPHPRTPLHNAPTNPLPQPSTPHRRPLNTNNPTTTSYPSAEEPTAARPKSESPSILLPTPQLSAPAKTTPPLAPLLRHFASPPPRTPQTPAPRTVPRDHIHSGLKHGQQGGPGGVVGGSMPDDG